VAERIVVVGRGRLGSALAAALAKARVHVAKTSGRSPSPHEIAKATCTIVAVPDPALEATASRIAQHVDHRSVVLHVAGSRGPDALQPCRAAGAFLGVMHPLVSFASKKSVALRGATFVIGGDTRAVRTAIALAKKLGARPLHAGIHGPAYHAAAALSANGAVALAARSIAVLESLGVGRRDAERAIGALLASVAANVSELGVPAALTGPISRGDAETVAKHREALAAIDPRARRTYDALVPAITDVARELGADPRALARIDTKPGRDAGP
jgi:predicted short-subunit dehydrogenase-like oxidoreductase (DUF2520 family)